MKTSLSIGASGAVFLFFLAIAHVTLHLTGNGCITETATSLIRTLVELVSSTF